MPVKPAKSQSGLKNEHFKVFGVVLGESMDVVYLVKDRFCPIKSDKFLSCDDASWPRVREYVGPLFPNKSKYEI